MKTEKNWEPYLTGSGIMAAWMLIFLKIALGLEWGSTLFASIVAGMLYFLVAVLTIETSKMKGGL